MKQKGPIMTKKFVLMTDWEYAQVKNGWDMPAAPAWKRLPIVRHFRAIYASIQVARHNYFYRQIGLMRTGYDEWVCAGIWQGNEANHD